MDVTDDGQANEDDDDDDDDDDDSDDSDDGFQITLEKPEGAKPNPPAGAKHLLRPTGVRTASGTPDVPQPTGTPTNASERSQGNSAQPLKVESQRSAAPSATKGVLTHGGKEGKDFPEVRTSSIDVEANPIWGGDNGKPLMEVDIDADLAEHSKPWRLPGTDQTDFFNYGFDEYTWTQYCVRQQAMAGTI
ncbi:uncharacterized protein K489DRAFT_340920, partial [Dissoconium aciculare CBS 342.82]|uniref:Pre-mRNA polyadenylation factor Fip1 domain-containing protein n=1 Tax=Dissoconium aciculare CBS 342.82 TaxID=1314786 RepID=A0A6J3M0U4_9PEZI